MNHASRILVYLTIIYVGAVQAQLAVVLSPARIEGQKAIVSLTMTNYLAKSVESARANCFLLDERGTMVGQSTKWVIGGTKARPALQPKSGTTFNFVITSPQPWMTTNVTAKISFSRVVLDSGKLADVRQDVSVVTAEK